MHALKCIAAESVCSYFNQSINRSIDQSINQSISQSINHLFAKSA